MIGLFGVSTEDDNFFYTFNEQFEHGEHLDNAISEINQVCSSPMKLLRSTSSLKLRYLVKKPNASHAELKTMSGRPLFLCTKSNFTENKEGVPFFWRLI